MHALLTQLAAMPTTYHDQLGIILAGLFGIACVLVSRLWHTWFLEEEEVHELFAPSAVSLSHALQSIPYRKAPKIYYSVYALATAKVRIYKGLGKITLEIQL